MLRIINLASGNNRESIEASHAIAFPAIFQSSAKSLSNFGQQLCFVPNSIKQRRRCSIILRCTLKPPLWPRPRATPSTSRLVQHSTKLLDASFAKFHILFCNLHYSHCGTCAVLSFSNGKQSGRTQTIVALLSFCDRFWSLCLTEFFQNALRHVSLNVQQGWLVGRELRQSSGDGFQCQELRLPIRLRWRMRGCGWEHVFFLVHVVWCRSYEAVIMSCLSMSIASNCVYLISPSAQTCFLPSRDLNCWKKTSKNTNDDVTVELEREKYGASERNIQNRW